MKTKGVTIIKLPENSAFCSILISLLPIFQTRLDIVAEWKFMLYGVTFLVTGIWVAAGLMGLREQGKLRPVRHIVSSSCAGWVNWTGCHNSCFANDDNVDVVYN